MTKPLTVVIQRENWIRGEDPSDSFLLRESDRKMCCLGFALCAARVPHKVLRGRGAPLSVGAALLPKRMLWLLTHGATMNSPDGEELMRLNDDTSTAEDEREKGIKVIFAEHNVKVTFRGKKRE